MRAATATELRETLARLKGQARPLQGLGIERRAEAIALSFKALSQLSDVALKSLALEMGTSTPACRWALAQGEATWGGDRLLRLFEGEIGPLESLEGWVSRSDGPRWRVFPPGLCLHIQASTLGVPGLEGAAFSLLLGGPCLIKTPRSGGQMALIGAFRGALATHAPVLADALASLYWPGGDEALESIAFQAADVCLFQGGDGAMGDIRRRLPPTTRFIPHPNRFSIAYLEANPGPFDKAAAALVEDICRYDQQGCLSPRGIFLKGTMAQAKGLMAAMIAAFDARDPEELTPLNLEAQGALAQLRGRLAFSGSFYATDAYGVGVDPGPYGPPPSARVGLIFPVDNLGQALSYVEAYRGRIQGAALGVKSTSRAAVAGAFASSGVPYLTHLGAIQKPAAGWPADGRPLLGDLCRVSMLA